MYFGTAATASAFVFGLCFLVSLLLGGKFANITVSMLEQLTQGYYDGAVY